MFCQFTEARTPHATEKNSKLNEKIRTLGESDRKMKKVGDFNYPKFNWEEVSCNTEKESKEALFLEVVRDSYLTQYVKEHTRITANSQPSLLDLLLASPRLDILDVEYMKSLGNNDHVMINAIFDLKCMSTPIQLIKRNYKKCDYHRLLLDQDWPLSSSTKIWRRAVNF